MPGGKCGLFPGIEKLHQSAEYKQREAENDLLRAVGRDRLLEFAKAEKEGRMEILPCKTGESVWITRSYARTHNPPIAGEVIGFEVFNDGNMTVQVLIWADLGEGRKKYGFSKESFGKIIFLSKKEAEAALREQEG